jgi:hypothetical protein
MLSTPWGKRGRFYEAWERGGDDYERVSVPWQACARLDVEFVAHERKLLPANAFASEWDCQFTDTEDSVFSSSDIEALFSDPTVPLLFPERVGALESAYVA